MTETVRPEPSKALERRSDPEIDRLARIGTWLAASESNANDEKSRGMSAALRLYYAEQLGLPPLAASELSIVNGRLYPHAKLLRALAARDGYRVERADCSDTSCTAILYKDGEEMGRYTFTIQDAERAKLIRDKSAWQTHPARMLWARACKFVLDDYAPQVTLGLGVEEELDEILPPPAPAPASAEPVEDGDWEPAQPVERESDEELRIRLFRRLAVIIERAETDQKALLPKGHASWEDYSRFLAHEQYGVASRSELTTEQLAEFVRLVDNQAIPF